MTLTHLNIVLLVRLPSLCVMCMVRWRVSLQARSLRRLICFRLQCSLDRATLICWYVLSRRLAQLSQCALHISSWMSRRCLSLLTFEGSGKLCVSFCLLRCGFSSLLFELTLFCLLLRGDLSFLRTLLFSCSLLLFRSSFLFDLCGSLPLELPLLLSLLLCGLFLLFLPSRCSLESLDARI